VGKTQTAAEFAHRNRGEYRHLLWADADTPDTLASSYSAIARALDLPDKDESDLSRVVAAVLRWFESQDGWLLVLDNADDLAAVQNLIPASAPGHLLLTTREPALVGLAIEPIPVGELSDEEGARLVLRRAGLLPAGVSIDRARTEHREGARAISRLLGGLPLALDQAGAFIDEFRVSPAAYIDLFPRKTRELLERRGRLGGTGHAPVLATFRLALQRLSSLSAAAADLLRFCAFLAPEPLPESVLIENESLLGGRLGPAMADPFVRLMTFEAAARLSLLRRTADDGGLTVHRLVQTVIRQEMTPEEQWGWAERAVCAMNRSFPIVVFNNWRACDRLLPHTRACAEWVKEFSLEIAEAGRLLRRTADYLESRALYGEAEVLYRRALGLLESVLGSDHPSTAASLNNLAGLLWHKGNMSEAEPFYRRALAAWESVRGADHPSTATSLNNLAGLLRAQGRLAEAEPLYRRALAVRERALGPDHPDTAASLNNLAALLQAQGRLPEAEPLLRRAHDALVHALGGDSIKTKVVYDNLIIIYNFTNDSMVFQPTPQSRPQAGSAPARRGIEVEGLDDIESDWAEKARTSAPELFNLTPLSEDIDQDSPGDSM
jgi:tetratricopeptide (TPR) repeat protein